MSRVEMALRRRLLELSGEIAQVPSETDIDALIGALDRLGAATGPEPDLPSVEATFELPQVNRPDNVFYFRGRSSAEVWRTGRVFSQALSPRVQGIPEPALPAAVRSELVRLRTTVMLAMQTEALRSVLLCGAAEAEHTELIAAQLSQMLADYEWLKVAFIRVVDEEPPLPRQPLSRMDYTFVVRRTQRANLYEIGVSGGPVTLHDWLRCWEPARVLEEMKKKFDLIVIAAPPVMQTPGVALLAEAVDGVILAATENVTSYADVELAGQQFEAAHTRILGVTLMRQADSPALLDRLKQFARRLMHSRTPGAPEPQS